MGLVLSSMHILWISLGFILWILVRRKLMPSCLVDSSILFQTHPKYSSSPWQVPSSIWCPIWFLLNTHLIHSKNWSLIILLKIRYLICFFTFSKLLRCFPRSMAISSSHRKWLKLLKVQLQWFGSIKMCSIIGGSFLFLNCNRKNVRRSWWEIYWISSLHAAKIPSSAQLAANKVPWRFKLLHPF